MSSTTTIKIQAEAGIANCRGGRTNLYWGGGGGGFKRGGCRGCREGVGPSLKGSGA